MKIKNKSIIHFQYLFVVHLCLQKTEKGLFTFQLEGGKLFRVQKALMHIIN